MLVERQHNVGVVTDTVFDVCRACFLTSSLVAMLSLTLTIPMTALAHILLKQDVSTASFTKYLYTCFCWNNLFV